MRKLIHVYLDYFECLTYTSYDKFTKGHASVHFSLLCLIMLCIFKLIAHKQHVQGMRRMQ